MQKCLQRLSRGWEIAWHGIQSNKTWSFRGGGEAFLNFLWTFVREDVRWGGGKLVITRLVVAREGKSKTRVVDSRFGIDGNRFDPR